MKSAQTSDEDGGGDEAGAGRDGGWSEAGSARVGASRAEGDAGVTGAMAGEAAAAVAAASETLAEGEDMLGMSSGQGNTDVGGGGA